MSADAAMALVRALARAARAAGYSFDLVEIASRAWSSALFSGQRHRVIATVSGGENLDFWVEEAPEAQLTMPGHVVLDLAVRAVDRGPRAMTVELAVVTLADADGVSRRTAGLPPP